MSTLDLMRNWKDWSARWAWLDLCVSVIRKFEGPSSPEEVLFLFFFFFLFFLFCWGLVLWFFIHLNLDLHFCPPYYAFSVCLGTTYLIETENFLLKVLYIKVKISQIVQWNPWIISKNLVGLMNNSKNKLKVEIRWKIQLIPNAH